MLSLSLSLSLSPSLSLLPSLPSKTITQLKCIYAADIDYQSVSMTLLFEHGQHQKCESIEIEDDAILEDTEYFILQLTTSDDDVQLGIDSARIVVVDDDNVTVGLDHEAYSIDESSGQVTVCVSLTGDIERSVTVSVHTQPVTAQGKEGGLLCIAVTLHVIQILK